MAKSVIPAELLVPAIEETMRKYPGYCVDNWGEEEASVCRRMLPVEWAHVETDIIRKESINLRKAGKLTPINGGPKRRKLEDPTGRYAEYLASEHWVQFRLKVLDAWNGECCICRDKAKDVHHNTYIRLGREDLFDCVPLCRPCHVRVHGAMPDGNEELNETKENCLF